MKLVALVKDLETKKVEIIERDSFGSKKEFKEVLRQNGYSVKRISNARDLAVQEIGYKSFADFQRLKNIWFEDEELWVNEIAVYTTIKNIKL